MMRFRYKQSVPPGGKWFYRVPETEAGIWFESFSSKLQLQRMVEDYLVLNKKEVPKDLPDRIENFICRHVGGGFCEGEDQELGSKPVQPVTFFEVVRQLELFYRGKKRSLVSRREAERRAGICRPCAEHVLGLCTKCNGLRDTASRFVRGRTSPQDPWMGVCRRYMLPLSGLIHTKVEGWARPDGAPEQCWVREGNNGTDAQSEP